MKSVSIMIKICMLVVWFGTSYLSGLALIIGSGTLIFADLNPTDLEIIQDAFKIALLIFVVSTLTWIAIREGMMKSIN